VRENLPFLSVGFSISRRKWRKKMATLRTQKSIRPNWFPLLKSDLGKLEKISIVREFNRLQSLQLQCQRCSRLERSSKYVEENIFDFKTH
jgi:hypothetical protein